MVCKSFNRSSVSFRKTIDTRKRRGEFVSIFLLQPYLFWKLHWYNYSSAEKLRESFVLDYGILLMGHKSLWQVGLSYLDNCPNDGLQVIEVLLPRIYPENEAKAQKIIREAKSRGLLNIGKKKPN